MFKRWLKEEEGRRGELGVLYWLQKNLPIPLYAQEAEHWCGPACGQMVLSYLGRYHTQSYLAGPWNPTKNLYGMETTSTEGTHLWKLARTLNALDDGTIVPSWWIWSNYNANGQGNEIMNRLCHNLDSYNLPVVNRVRTAPDPANGKRLEGFVGNYGHYIVTHGVSSYSLGGPFLIRYSNSYEDPLNGVETSLGQFWINANILLDCNTVYDGGWIIW